MPARAASGDTNHQKIDDCLADVSYPQLPVQDLNSRLSIDGIRPEFVQFEYRQERGRGNCRDLVADIALNGDCPRRATQSEETMSEMLGGTPDEVAETEFARGAISMTTEAVIGRAKEGVSFHYRMTSWKYPSTRSASNSAVLRSISDCSSAESDGQGTELSRDGKPYLRVLKQGDSILLVESLSLLPPSGESSSTTKFTSTLLPSRAFDQICSWWGQHANSPALTMR